MEGQGAGSSPHLEEEENDRHRNDGRGHHPPRRRSRRRGSTNVAAGPADFAAATATTTPSSSPSSCDACVELLRHVLSLPESLPHRLLQSLADVPAVPEAQQQPRPTDNIPTILSVSLPRQVYSSPSAQQPSSSSSLVTRAVDGGIQVQIPAENPMTERRHWRDLLLPPVPTTTVAVEMAVQYKRGDDRGGKARTTTKISGDRGGEGNGHGTRTKTSAGLSGAEPALPSPLPTLLPSPAAPSRAPSFSPTLSQPPPPPPPLLHRLATSPSRNLEGLPSSQQPKSSAATHPKHEWLTFRCRHCSDVGPEGGARAFVMGPHPLSVVVCHNRLLQQQQQQQQQPPPPIDPPHQRDGSSAPSTSFECAASEPSTTAPSGAPPPPPPTAAAPAPSVPTFSKAGVDEMNEILSHELSHVYDVRKLLLDLRDCENLAYSEVRAARIAECRAGNDGEGGGGAGAGAVGSTGSGFGGLRSWYLPSYYGGGSNNNSSSLHQQRSCVRQKAVTATLNLFPGQARACLNAVFDAAMADHRPVLPPPPQATSQSSTPASSPAVSSGAVPVSSLFRAGRRHGTESASEPPRPLHPSASQSGAPPASSR